MKPGTKPKPTVLKILEGNPGKRPLPTDEPQPDKGTPEVFIVGLVSDELYYRDRCVEVISDMGVLTHADGGMLDQLAMAYALIDKAHTALIRDGYVVETSRGPMRNPMYEIYVRASRDAQRLSEHFGLSPAARTRIHAPEAREKEVDEFAAIQNITALYK